MHALDGTSRPTATSTLMARTWPLSRITVIAPIGDGYLSLNASRWDSKKGGERRGSLCFILSSFHLSFTND